MAIERARSLALTTPLLLLLLPMTFDPTTDVAPVPLLTVPFDPMLMVCGVRTRIAAELSPALSAIDGRTGIVNLPPPAMVATVTP